MSTYPTPLITRLLPDTATVSPDGVLHVAGHSLPALAQQYDTPLYIFDRATVLNACASYQRAFQRYYSASAVQFLYASKAYLSPHLARIMAEQGLGLDIVSGGSCWWRSVQAFRWSRSHFMGTISPKMSYA